jgi:hypothetical protein
LAIDVDEKWHFQDEELFLMTEISINNPISNSLKGRLSYKRGALKLNPELGKSEENVILPLGWYPLAIYRQKSAECPVVIDSTLVDEQWRLKIRNTSKLDLRDISITITAPSSTD